jgi:hypothetical protein
MVEFPPQHFAFWSYADVEYDFWFFLDLRWYDRTEDKKDSRCEFSVRHNQPAVAYFGQNSARLQTGRFAIARVMDSFLRFLGR